ncbi:hypothetical protein F4861DRAFT_427020 [Xylaria intraflava]|nr:hypothetical protein F4861DRAFT_427020 [Xylaria intraflava]
MVPKRAHPRQVAISEHAKRPRLDLARPASRGDSSEMTENYSPEVDSNIPNEFTRSNEIRTSVYRSPQAETVDGDSTRSDDERDENRPSIPASPDDRSPQELRAERRIAEQREGDFTDEEEEQTPITDTQAPARRYPPFYINTEGDAEYDSVSPVDITRAGPAAWLRSPGRTRPLSRLTPSVPALPSPLRSSRIDLASSPSPSSSSSSSSERSMRLPSEDLAEPEESDSTLDRLPGAHSMPAQPNGEGPGIVYRRGGMTDYFLTRYLGNVGRTLNFMVRAEAAGIDVSDFDSLAAVSPDRWADLADTPADAAEIVVKKLLNMPLSDINILAARAANLRRELLVLGVSIE